MKHLLTVLIALTMLLTFGCDGDKAKEAADKAKDKAEAAGIGPDAICKAIASKMSEEEKGENDMAGCAKGMEAMKAKATPESFKAFGACAVGAGSKEEFQGCMTKIKPKDAPAPEASK